MNKNRRQFLESGLAALALGAFNLKTGKILAEPYSQIDISQLQGMDALRWYAQKLVVISPDDLEFKVFEREAKESMSLPYKVNGAYAYLENEISLHIGRPDIDSKFIMTYTDSNGISKNVHDGGLKGHLGSDADTINDYAGLGNNTEEKRWWYGYGGYRLFRLRALGYNEEPSPQSFKINGEPYFIGSGNVLEGIADYNTTMAPLLTGVYEGKHFELLRRREQIFMETNAQYRKNLQLIVRELEREGKIVLN